MNRKCVWALSVLVLCCVSCQTGIGEPVTVMDISSDYIAAWKMFNPSRAVSRGMLDAVFGFEDHSSRSVRRWIVFNRSVLERLEALEPSAPLDDRIDARLIKIQIKNELRHWEEVAPHINSPTLYSGLLSRAVSRVLSSDLLMPDEKCRLVWERLEAIRRMCVAAEVQLKDGSPEETERSLRSLEEAAGAYERLPERIAALIPPEDRTAFAASCRDTAAQVRNLSKFIRETILPHASLSDSPILGRDAYARELAVYTDSGLTPEELESIALEEIDTVRSLIAELSAAYLKEALPGQAIPQDYGALTALALVDMEKNHPMGEQDYLLLLRGYAREAEEFVREKRIATLPAHQTLSVELAPESAGPMARIGYVRPAPPFHPNPWTTWYLATIPDTHPEQEREDFWRSFNNHFKKFIVIHELFPGHYLQSKIVRENPRPVRILFPYGPYSEGWATLCERVALEAGWDEGNKLTRLAQLRKRLENANRAYTSVQVHCNGWSEEQMLEFSVGTSLLAPQFAKSLWGRLMRSPFQMTTYFLGNAMFTEVYEAEMRRLGDRFDTLVFMDTILRAGPIPIDAFPEVFQALHD